MCPVNRAEQNEKMEISNTKESKNRDKFNWMKIHISFLLGLHMHFLALFVVEFLFL